MQKANLIEIPHGQPSFHAHVGCGNGGMSGSRSRRTDGRITHAAPRGAIASLLGRRRVCSVASFAVAASFTVATSFAVSVAAVTPAWAAEGDHSAAASSMQQIIEAARRKKAQELDTAARRLLGTDAIPAAPSPVPLPQMPPPSAHESKTEEIPRVWSLTGVGQRLEAELYYQGRIHRVSLSSAPSPQVGPWRVRSITPTGVTVQLNTSAQGKGRAPASMVLPPPARGSTLSGYPFQPGAPGAVGGPLSLSPGSSALPPSAFRASQLPLEAPVALASQQGR